MEVVRARRVASLSLWFGVVKKMSSKEEVTEPRRGKNKAHDNGSTNGAKAKVLNTNVLVCIGYRNHLSSRSDENSAIGVNGADGSGDGATKRCWCNKKCWW